MEPVEPSAEVWRMGVRAQKGGILISGRNAIGAHRSPTPVPPAHAATGPPPVSWARGFGLSKCSQCQGIILVVGKRQHAVHATKGICANHIFLSATEPEPFNGRSRVVLFVDGVRADG